MSLTVTVVAPASREATWEVWADLAGWPRWNPMCVSAEVHGALVPGTELALRLVHPRGRDFYTRPRLTVVEPPRRIAWEATAPGLRLTTETALDDEPDGTRVTVTSRTSGRMGFALRMMALGDRPLARMYAAMLNALVADLKAAV